MKQTKKMIYLSIAWISLFLGFIGAFLPVLPTTPFAILSAYLFSKSSPRLHLWLLQQPVLGKVISQWEQHGIIRIKAKIISTIMIIALFSYTLIYVQVAVAIKIVVSLIGLSVLGFIWTRPSHPKI